MRCGVSVGANARAHQKHFEGSFSSIPPSITTFSSPSSLSSLPKKPAPTRGTDSRLRRSTRHAASRRASRFRNLRGGIARGRTCRMERDTRPRGHASSHALRKRVRMLVTHRVPVHPPAHEASRARDAMVAARRVDARRMRAPHLDELGLWVSVFVERSVRPSPDDEGGPGDAFSSHGADDMPQRRRVVLRTLAALLLQDSR